MTKELLTSNLRVIEPFRLYGHVLAEVFVSSIGLPPSLAMQFDTEDGGEASVTLTAREAHDLMLWLRGALNLDLSPVAQTSTPYPESVAPAGDGRAHVQSEVVGSTPARRLPDETTAVPSSEPCAHYDSTGRGLCEKCGQWFMGSITGASK